MTRLACLYVPLIPLAARLRGEPDLKGEAMAVFEGNGHAARLVAASRRARRAGVRPGMSLSQARALLPKLAARPRDELCERTAQQSLLEVAESFSPRIEDAGEGVVYLELDGLERQFPGQQPERDLGHALTVAADKASLPAWVGIASSKLAARVAAEQPGSPTIVPTGKEAAFLAPLPLARLSPEAEVLETLNRWGIRSVGELARLPKNEVASRLGDAGRRLHEKARGMDPHPLVPYQPPPVFEEGLELEWPLVALEPFLFVGRAALGRLCRRLEARGLACARLELTLRLESGGRHERALELPAPTREAKTLLTLVRLDLEQTPPGAPVTGFLFLAHPDRPREAQLSLFGPAAVSPDRLATTLARLFALLGPGRVGSPRTADGHRPERTALVEYAPPPPPKIRPEPQQGRGLLAVRVLRPPVPLEVLTEPFRAGERNGATVDGTAPPREILSIAGEATAKRPRLQGRVKVASGPWTLEEEWWSESPAERDYWDVELTDGGLYRIFRERRTGEWFADGIYD
ncbi:MAG: DNA polymerase Y family protein [Thermoanaerobaculia bacterium]